MAAATTPIAATVAATAEPPATLGPVGEALAGIFFVVVAAFGAEVDARGFDGVVLDTSRVPDEMGAFDGDVVDLAVDDFEGDVGPAEAVDLILLSEAAVGLLNRSTASVLSVAFLTAVGTGGGGLRDFASEAAVGANKPDDGVFGRGTAVVGVLDRNVDGVLDRGGVGAAFTASLLLEADAEDPIL